jgi:predicted lipoprotein with Yx(FWY)xxD motif
VDAGGRTLYLFQQDTGTTSTCSGDCATTWPALTTDGAPTAGDGAQASLLGTTARDDGTTQVTYAGHPLYLFSGDAAPGDTNGQGIGGVWFASTPDGTPAAAAGGSGGGDGGYTRGGYG